MTHASMMKFDHRWVVIIGTGDYRSCRTRAEARELRDWWARYLQRAYGLDVPSPYIIDAGRPSADGSYRVEFEAGEPVDDDGFPVEKIY